MLLQNRSLKVKLSAVYLLCGGLGDDIIELGAW